MCIRDRPQAYWINTSGNDMVKRFVDKADKTTQQEIERLIDGEAIAKDVQLELTYDEVDRTCLLYTSSAACWMSM